jgi:divalent metal cation (Fe/Co/Zn/Cd) transporter
MDEVDIDVHQNIEKVLNKCVSERGLKYHHLKDRASGYCVFIEFHLLFPKEISLQNAHEIASEIESILKASIQGGSEILTHLEPEEHHDLIHKKYGLTV